MERGIRRNLIFQDDFDYQVFLQIMRMELLNNDCTLHAYCLMSNHFHLLIETGGFEIGRFMKALASKYAMQYNHRYAFRGHVFEDRYVSKIIEDDDYFLQVSRYIHLNPIKAKMARNPEDYNWSSYRSIIGVYNDGICYTEKTLDFFQKDGVDGYIEFVADIGHEYIVLEDEIKESMGENELWLPW